VSPDPLPQWSTLRERIERVEAEAIREALVRCEGNRRRMAEALGLSRPGLRYKMRRLGLDSPDEK
jgi:two-component system response regulator HupR/HoxA